MEKTQANRDAALRRLRRVNASMAAGSVIGAGAIMAVIASTAKAEHHTVVVSTPATQTSSSVGHDTATGTTTATGSSSTPSASTTKRHTLAASAAPSVATTSGDTGSAPAVSSSAVSSGAS